MAVIVHDGHAAHVAHVREAPTHALEAREGLRRVVGGKPQYVGHCQGGGGVQHVMAAGIALDGDVVLRAVG